MNTDRRNDIVLGALLISGMAFGILSSVPALEFPGYMTALPAIGNQVLWAVFFQAAMAVVYVFIAVSTFPLVKRFSGKSGHAYFALRIIGAGFLFVGICSLLLLLWLSQAFVTSGQAEVSHMLIIGELLRRGRDFLNHIGLILPWSLGGLILYYSFLKLRFLPRWLSIWGLCATFSTLISTLLYMLAFIEMASPLYLLMNAPAALAEIVLAFYLFFKGFIYPTSSFTLA